jgi:hypothetical protein
VWLNPPYAQPLMEQFVDKLIGALAAGRVRDAILLTHNCTDTAWVHQAESVAILMCFTKGRIKFMRADGFQASPPQGQAFFYFGGSNGRRFVEVFSPFGFIVEPIR